jgi:hypothetical protein
MSYRHGELPIVNGMTASNRASKMMMDSIKTFDIQSELTFSRITPS